MSKFSLVLYTLIFLDVTITYGEDEHDSGTLISEIEQFAKFANASSVNITQLLNLYAKVLEKLEIVQERLRQLDTNTIPYNCTYTPYLVVCISLLFGFVLIVFQSTITHFQQMYTFRVQQKHLKKHVHSQCEGVKSELNLITAAKLPELRGQNR